jgi:hypothetical protein
MPIANAQLVVVQGATLKQDVTCDLSETPYSIANLQAWATGGATLSLSVGLRGDSNFKVVASGAVTITGNVARLELDEAVTATITDLNGRWVVEATNGVDRFRIADGSWYLRRDTA